MRPVLTAAEMRAVDAVALEDVGFAALVERAGGAVARHALALLGGAYGRRVVVVAGRGHNGDDGRVAARRLRARGCAVVVVDAAAPGPLPPCDLVIDAAYGTGFRGDYDAPAIPAAAAVLAVDIPSGVRADTGAASPGAVRADETVTFGALKPGLLLAPGRDLAGVVQVEPIGLPVTEASCHEVTDADLGGVPRRPREAHKWQTACYVAAGSPGMTGAAWLAARAAARAGAGMIRLGSPGAAPGSVPVTEAVARELPAEGWAPAVLAELGRCRALVLGPGLGRSPAAAAAVRQLVAESPVPVVLDADGLNALGAPGDGAVPTSRRAPLVLTPHDGEFARLAGAPPGEDRIAAARDLARRLGAVVLLKGSTTVVADAAGAVLISTAGSARLATAGTGDVLAGVIGAFLARGLPPLEAAAFASFAHGRAAALGRGEGLVAPDLPDLVADVLAAEHGALGPGEGAASGAGHRGLRAHPSLAGG